MYGDPVSIPADISDLVENQCATSAECKTIRIAVSTVMDYRLDLRDSLKCFVFKLKVFSKGVFGKMTLGVSVLWEYGKKGTRRGMPK